MKKYIFLKLLVLLGTLCLNAQSVSSPFALGKSCENAPIICPFDGYSDRSGGANSLDQPITFCSSVQNNRWIAFIAGSETLVCDFSVGDDCLWEEGLQVQVYANCGDPWYSASNCLYEVPENTTKTLTMNDLIIGEKYYVMIDGKSGDSWCSFSFDVTEGFTMSSNTSNIANAGEDIIFKCTDEESILDGSNSNYGVNDSVYWVNENDDVISNDVMLTVTEPGKYFLIIQENGNGCMSIDEVEVIEETFPNPFLYTWANYIIDTIGQPVFIEAIDPSLVDSNYIYSWTTTNGVIEAHADSIFPLISDPGHYYVEIINPVSECIFNGFVFVNSLKIVNVFSPEKKSLKVKVSPTITNEEIRVHYVMENANFVSLQVYNIGGVLLQDLDFGKKATGEHVETLSLKDFTAGVYFIFVKTQEGSAVRKVVKM